MRLGLIFASICDFGILEVKSLHETYECETFYFRTGSLKKLNNMIEWAVFIKIYAEELGFGIAERLFVGKAMYKVLDLDKKCVVKVGGHAESERFEVTITFLFTT